MEKENKSLEFQNQNLQAFVDNQNADSTNCVETCHNLAKHGTDRHFEFESMRHSDLKLMNKETKLEDDLHSLVEYVKAITDETTIMRRRIYKCENVINQLRRAGEGSA